MARLDRDQVLTEIDKERSYQYKRYIKWSDQLADAVKADDLNRANTCWYEQQSARDKFDSLDFVHERISALQEV